MKLKFVFLFLSIAISVAGQYNETLRGARPGNVIGAFTVGKGVLQLHQGVDFLQAEEVRNYISSNGFPFEGYYQLENTVFQNTIRYGIIEKLELSAVLNYNWKNTYNNFDANPDPALSFSNSKEVDFQNIDLGLRYNILDGTNRARLVWGIQLRSNVYQWIADDRVLAPDLKLVTALARAFTKHHAVRLNLGTTLVEFDNSSLIYGLNYIFRPISQFGITLEYSGEASNFTLGPTIITHRYLCGLHYMISKDVQLDLRAGINETEMAIFTETYYFGAGMMWRIRTIKR
jgi:hypothetical protein